MLMGMLRIKLNSKTVFTQKLLSENTRAYRKAYLTNYKLVKQ